MFGCAVKATSSLGVRSPWSNPIQYRAEKQSEAKGCQKKGDCHFYLFEKLLLLGQDSDSHRTSYVISTCHHMYLYGWGPSINYVVLVGLWGSP